MSFPAGILLSSLPIDLSSYGADLLPTIALQARHQSQAVREEALTVLSALAGRCSDAEAVKGMFLQLKAILGGEM